MQQQNEKLLQLSLKLGEILKELRKNRSELTLEN